MHNKSKIELEENILAIINRISDEYPELSKYIPEMPLNGTEEDDVMIKNLEDYHHTLEDLVHKYAKTHPKTTAHKGSETSES